MTNAATAEDFKLKGNFESVRRILMDGEFASRLERPLSFWARSNDRRLPFAFLDRSISDLLNTPYDDLSATPGIGQKKIGALINLLHRVVEIAPPEEDFPVPVIAPAANPSLGIEDKFDPSEVADSQWSVWKETVRSHVLGHELLGRLAPSLQGLPTVIWDTPLNSYMDLTVSEMRELKTYGEKRVNAVLEVFYYLHRMLRGTEVHGCFAVNVAPGFVRDMEMWVAWAMRQQVMPSEDEMSMHLIQPLLHQILVDAGPVSCELVSGRLGTDGNAKSVRAQSEELGVTRARVYQLLDDCARIVAIRWPNGIAQLDMLADHFARIDPASTTVARLNALRTLLFSHRRDGN